MEPDPNLVARLSRHGQEGLLRWWGDLDDDARGRLASELESIDFDRLDELVRTLVRGEQAEPAAPGEVLPVEVYRLPQTDGERSARRHVAEIGEEALRRGEVAVVVVAGGSGTRLGFDGPKGTFPIGPVSGASLFQIHAEKIVALGRRYGRHLPLYVMTSPENHEATVRFFEEHDRFGLKHVRFFVQGRMPAVDRQTGKVVLASKGEVALSPDGHGGTIAALATNGPDGGPSCLQEMASQGIKTLFYFQVDNPLVQIADPAFLGLHAQAAAEMSFKVIEKVAPDEKVGVVVTVDGTPQVIEYSDLPAELAERREPDGRLQLWAGSIAIHLFELAFIERLASGEIRLPFHRAIKKVSYVGAGWSRRQTRVAERGQVRAVHLRRLASRRALDARRDRPGPGVRAAQECNGARLAGDGPAADERQFRRLARGGRGEGVAALRRVGSVRGGDQPAVGARCGRIEGESAGGPGGHGAAILEVSGSPAFSAGGTCMSVALDESAIQTAVRRIVERFDPDRVLLFGSRARGDAREDSDYDLLIVGPSDEPRGSRTAEVYPALLGLCVPIDVLWWTAEEIDEWSEVRSHFINRALRDAKVLYEKDARRPREDALGKGRA